MTEFDPATFCSVSDLTVEEQLIICDAYTDVVQLRRKAFLCGQHLPSLPTAEELLMNCGYTKRKKRRNGQSRTHQKRSP